MVYGSAVTRLALAPHSSAIRSDVPANPYFRLSAFGFRENVEEAVKRIRANVKA